MISLLQPTSWGFYECTFWVLIAVAAVLLIRSVRKRSWKTFTAFFSILLSAFAFLSFFGLDMKVEAPQANMSRKQIHVIVEEIAERLSTKKLESTLRSSSETALGRDLLLKTVRDISTADPKNADPIERKKLKALIALHDGNFEQAEKILTEVVHDMTESSTASKEQLAEAYRQLGSVAFYADPYRAISAYKNATALDGQGFDEWNQLGRLYMAIGKPDLAELCFMEVLSLAKQRRDPYATVVAHDNLGNVAYYRGDFEEAEKQYLHALSWVEAYGDKKVIAFPCSNLGNVYADKGEFEKALKYYRMALVQCKI